MPHAENIHSNVNIPNNSEASPNTKPLFNSLAGFALEIGDRLFINGEEVTFKGWVDQSQTAIEVKAIANNNSIKQIRAREIKSLWRSLDFEATPKQSAQDKSNNFYNAESNVNTAPESADRISSDREFLNNAANANNSEIPTEPKVEEVAENIPESVKEPEYNAWEVWTYLERQRVNTLKLLNTFQAEWEANRFVREAERSTPANLRVHYEIRPIWLDASEVNGFNQNNQDIHKSSKRESDRDQRDQVDYVDAIDVEVVAQS